MDLTLTILNSMNLMNIKKYMVIEYMKFQHMNSINIYFLSYVDEMCSSEGIYTTLCINSLYNSWYEMFPLVLCPQRIVTTGLCP